MIKMDDIKFNETNEFLQISNGTFMFQFNKMKKTYDLTDLLTNKSIFSDAFYEIDIKSDNLPLKIVSKEILSLHWEIQEISTEIGTGKVMIIQQDHETLQIKFKVYCYANSQSIFFQLSFEPGTNPFFLDSVKLLILADGKISVNTSKEVKILKNDWQSWSPIEIVALDFKDKRPNVKVERRSKRSFERKPHAGEIWSDFFSFAKNIQSQDQIFFGFVTLKDQLAQIQWKIKNKAKIELVECRCSGDSISLEKGDMFDSEILMCSSEKYPLEEWAKITGKLMKKRNFNKVPNGWCSWYDYYNNIDEKKIALNIEAAQKLHNLIPLEYIQIDDGYECVNGLGDWLETDPKKFPNGLKALVQKIKAAGFKAGLWLAPFLVSKYSKLFKAHDDWIIRDSKGKPIWGVWPFMGASSLLGAIFKDRVYALDLTHPEVQVWLGNLFKTLVDEIGFEYLKIDFIYAGAMEGIRYNKKMTRIQAYRKGLEIIREAMGDKTFLLGCGAPFGPSIGLVDATRVSTDTAPSFKVPFILKFVNKLLFANLETIPSVESAMQQNILRYFFHEHLWINDPDALIVRRESHLSPDEIQFEVTVIGLLGGLLFLGDNMAKLTPREIELIQILIPPYGTSASPLDLIEGNFPEILTLAIQTPFDNWKVIGLLNWSNKAKNSIIDLNKIFGPNQEKYHIFEFWEKKYLGIHEKEFKIDVINPHSAKLLAIHQVKAIPTLLSSSFHITQGGVEIKQFEFDPQTESLHIALEKQGEHKGNLYIYLPDPLQKKHIELKGDTQEFVENDHILIINLHFKNETKIALEFREPH
jgi:alpha-galactosidase